MSGYFIRETKKELSQKKKRQINFYALFNITFFIITKIFLIFFWLSSFLFPEKINRENKIQSKKFNLQNKIDPNFFLTFKSLFLVDRFEFYFEANSPWYNAIVLFLSKNDVISHKIISKLR